MKDLLEGKQCKSLVRHTLCLINSKNHQDCYLRSYLSPVLLIVSWCRTLLHHFLFYCDMDLVHFVNCVSIVIFVLYGTIISANQSYYWMSVKVVRINNLLNHCCNMNLKLLSKLHCCTGRACLTWTILFENITLRFHRMKFVSMIFITTVRMNHCVEVWEYSESYCFLKFRHTVLIV